MIKIQKKAQMSLGEAPTVVMIVGLVFLVMATMALIGQKYGDALDTDDTSFSKINETLTTVTEAGEYLSLSSQENAICNPVTIITNASSGDTITSTNYTQTNCLIQKIGAGIFNNTNWNVTYAGTYSAATISSNVTGDLEMEVSNNTSIVGMVLTISLIGIVLTILIGVFLGVTRRSRV